MKKLTFLLLAIGLWHATFSQPLPTKLNHNIIIDTDCAMDDMRAICLLLERPEIDIQAILVSDGSISPYEGAVKVSSLLERYDRKKIPVAMGEVLEGVDPPWREFNRQVSWVDIKIRENQQFLRATDYLSEILGNSKEKITLVCLGPLTNVADLIEKDKSLLAKIERVIWYNESAKLLQGFNYECDKAGADTVFRSGLRIDVVSNLTKSEAVFDSSLMATSYPANTVLAATLDHVYSQSPVKEKLYQHHFKLCDDLVALYITNPELFDMTVSLPRIAIRYNKDYDVPAVREAISDMIKGTYVSGNNVVFNEFPNKRGMFNYDIRPMMDSAIVRHGMEEWKASVMTDEFHGHLGVFSIVGAKMGIKAREIFGVGPDMLKVVTFAGSRPPYSCLNDGIQVSTGATLGMGTISVATDSIAKPSAVFTYGNRSVRITLKKEYLDQVDADINEGLVKFGLMDDGYWKLVRRNALKYWLAWDRNVIFEFAESRQ